MSQPIQSRQGSSTDTSPLITPSGTPPIYNHHSHQQHDKMQQFFSAYESGNAAVAGGRGWFEEGRARRKSDNWNGVNGQGESSHHRPSLPFFSNLSLSRPTFPSHTTTPLPQQQHQHQSTSMSKQNSDSGSSDTSGDMIRDGRPDTMKRAATLPIDPKEGRRHYDPCREPKLLHFM